MQWKIVAQKFGAAVLSFMLAFGSSEPVFGQSMSVVDLNMTVGKSLVIDYPVDIGRISTSSPEVVDAVPATAKEFLLHGKGHGSATVVVWAKNGARTMYNITVEHNVDPIKKLLAETFPGENIRIQSGRDSITLVGQVSSKDVADRAVAIATPLAKTVVSNLSVEAAPVEKQIVLRVKFAELNRNRANQFGVNLLSTGAANTPGRLTTGQFPAPSIGSVSGQIGGGLQGTQSTFTLSDALNVFAFRPDLNIGAVIRALQNEDVLQILAEPNLVTVNGKEANFLVGGEFPVPILQGGGNAGAVTIQFREFGIRLSFTPQITPNGTIKMYVKPEVSTIDLANAIQLSGFTIPALATRRMETNVELKEGQSFVVAGLIDDRVADQMSRIPGLSSIPILGAMFKSRAERKSKSELLVLVTPEIINADTVAPAPKGPDFPREFLKDSDLRRTSKLDSSNDKDQVASQRDSNDKKADPGFSPFRGVKNFFFRSQAPKPENLSIRSLPLPDTELRVPNVNRREDAGLPGADTETGIADKPDSKSAPVANASASPAISAKSDWKEQRLKAGTQLSALLPPVQEAVRSEP